MFSAIMRMRACCAFKADAATAMAELAGGTLSAI
jgi:hypothetical protein